MQFENVRFGMIRYRFHILFIGGIGRRHYGEIISSLATLLKRMSRLLFSLVCCGVFAIAPLSASPKTHSPKAYKHASHPKMPKHKAPKWHRSAHS